MRGMISILGLDLEAVKRVVNETGAQIANLNCPGQVVISGETEAVDKANGLALQYGARRAVNLQVNGAFHSSLMQPASKRLAQVLAGINIKQPSVEVVSNVTAAVENRPDKIKENLIKQLVGSVFWEESVRFMINKGVSQFFEIGLGKVLKGLLRKINSGVEVVNIQCKEDILTSSKKE